MQPAFPLILASGSPRRRELLDQMDLYIQLIHRMLTKTLPDVRQKPFWRFPEERRQRLQRVIRMLLYWQQIRLFLPMNRLENRIRPSVQKKC